MYVQLPSWFGRVLGVVFMPLSNPDAKMVRTSWVGLVCWVGGWIGNWVSGRGQERVMLPLFAFLRRL